MTAFRRAVDHWAVDMLEMDVRASRDGRIVVIHDATVDRTTDGSGEVASMPWDELRELDAGHRFRDLGGEASFAGTGVRLPLFRDVLEAFPTLRLNVEVKDPRAAPELVELIRRHDARHRVLVAAERERQRRGARGYAGPWGASREQLLPFGLLHRTPLSFLVTPACDVFQVPLTWRGREVVTPRFLSEAHRRNVPVHVWTVDEEAVMRRLLAMGVDGIQTDRPDVLARVLAEVTGRPPAPALRDPESS